MSSPSDPAERRAERLLAWYPRSWRARYGDEFVELLIADIEERPHSWARTADIARSGVVARLSTAGLTGRSMAPADQVRAGLVSLGCGLAAFVVFGAAMWSQLTIGWQWARPTDPGTTVAMVLMSVTMLVVVTLALLAAVPIAWGVLARMVRRQAAGLVRPAGLFVVGAGLLVVGSRHFGNGWPGTGGHPWADQGLVPGGVAAFTWASTLSVTSYWAHPGALLTFPAPEIAWMAISPVAMAFLIVGAVKTVRRLEVSIRVLRYERWLGCASTVAMTVFLAGAAVWIVDGGPGPKNLFHAGAIDIVGLLVMTAALAVAHRAALRARSARLAVGA